MGNLYFYNRAVERSAKALKLAKETKVKDIKLKAMKIYHNAMRDSIYYQNELKRLK